MIGARLRPSSNEHHRGATGETMGREANDEPRRAMRQATPADADVVQAISAGAYASAYLPVIGAVPKPASEDYRPRIRSAQSRVGKECVSTRRFRGSPAHVKQKRSVM